MKAFISYKHSDVTFAELIGSDLRQHGIAVWLDLWEIQPGGAITQTINRGLETSDIVLLLLSKASIQSRWVEREWSTKFGEEIKRGKNLVIPICIESPETLQIPPLLADKRYVQLTLENSQEGLLDIRSAVMAVLFPVDFDLRDAFSLGFYMVQFTGLSQAFPNTENYHFIKKEIEKILDKLGITDLGEWWVNFRPESHPLGKAVLKAHGPAAQSAFSLGIADMSLNNSARVQSVPDNMKEGIVKNAEKSLRELGLRRWCIEYRDLLDMLRTGDIEAFDRKGDSVRRSILSDLKSLSAIGED